MDEHFITKVWLSKLKLKAWFYPRDLQKKMRHFLLVRLKLKAVPAARQQVAPEHDHLLNRSNAGNKNSWNTNIPAHIFCEEILMIY